MKFENDKIGQDVNDIPLEIINSAFKEIERYLQRKHDLIMQDVNSGQGYLRQEKNKTLIFILRQLDETLNQCQEN